MCRANNKHPVNPSREGQASTTTPTFNHCLYAFRIDLHTNILNTNLVQVPCGRISRCNGDYKGLAINNGEGATKLEGEGRQVKFYPYKKGCVEKF